MTALWIAIAVLSSLLLMAYVAIGCIVFVVAPLLSVVNKHINDTQLHWSSKWEDNADA